MSEINEPTTRKPPSAGLGLFFGGMGIVVLDALVIAIALGTGFRPDDRTALLIWGLGGLGLLFMLLGLFKGVMGLVRTGHVGGFAIQGAILLVIAGVGYGGWTWWTGTPLPADELLPLLGKHRDDPAVQAAFRRLGP